MNLQNYQTDNFFDEMVTADGKVRPCYESIYQKLGELTSKELLQKQQTADKAFMTMGVTFNVYGDGMGVEKIFPFDIIPRVINGSEWDIVAKGLQQRMRALNLFIDDIYNDKKILNDNVVPKDLVLTSKDYLKQCEGFSPAENIWCHIGGIDLIRHSDGLFYVLEDNLRIPSGVSYVIENRDIMKRTFPSLFDQIGVRPVSDYPMHLLNTLRSVSYKSDPLVVLLTPGMYNSAYFEHSFLASQMGIELVEGQDLTVKDGYVQMRTTKGLKKVDVIYRRVDDEFLDPKVFNPDSLLGVPGIFEVYRNKKVSIVNAPGAGVADDKVICSFVPDMIKYYLGEDAIIPNVPTFLCWDKKQRQHICENIEKMVIKAANQSGGYGMLIGSDSTKEEQKEFIEKINDNPRGYIAQPIMSLSRVPTMINDEPEGRHVDLRPYILSGKDNIYVTPGGLTRVALRKGSLVVNSSQGGGSKDTWVIQDNNQNKPEVK